MTNSSLSPAAAASAMSWLKFSFQKARNVERGVVDVGAEGRVWILEILDSMASKKGRDIHLCPSSTSLSSLSEASELSAVVCGVDVSSSLGTTVLSLSDSISRLATSMGEVPKNNLSEKKIC